jgi:hypothetical protein
MNKHATWFRRAVWAGIIADWLLGVPTILWPAGFLNLLGMRPTEDPVWTAFAALLVVLLSIFYIPGAEDPYRYRFNAWLAVLARPPGVMFFLIFKSGYYPAFGYLDGALFLVQFPLLLLTLRTLPQPDWKLPNPVPQSPPDPAPVWLKRTIWAGIIADWVLGIPSIFAPEAVLNLIGVRPTGDPVWTAFAAMILILLSLFYIPGANDPYRYRYNAWMAVYARLAGIIFFFLLNPGVYPAFGYLDAGLFLVQFAFAVKTMQLRPEPGLEEDKAVFPYHGSTYREVKEAAWSGPYAELPCHQGLTPRKFFQFLNDSARNMHDRRDIRQKYDKLIHSHGICFAGLWKIDQDSPYTGYFAKGSTGLLIARASVAGPITVQGFPRSIGIAGKVFPTLDPDQRVWPGNFVTVSNLSGSRAKHITDIDMSNAPTVGWSPIANVINRVIFRMMDTRPGYRQLFPISTLGLKPGDEIVTPDLLMLKVDEAMPKVDAKDFRDELRLSNYPDHTLVYTINVKNFDEENWTRLGVLEFTEDVISEGSDKRLHFWIPRDIPTQKH